MDKGEVLCVIDLDTVMPSFVFSDFGDFLRSAANTAPEDEPDLNKIHFKFDIFKHFAKGYIESAKHFLTPLEIELLPYAVTLFPYMQAVRFWLIILMVILIIRLTTPSTIMYVHWHNINCIKKRKKCA